MSRPLVYSNNLKNWDFGSVKSSNRARARARTRARKDMWNLPNCISLFRFPLALLFLVDHTLWRTISLVLAMISDGLDGWVARKSHQTSKIGTIIDPIADKFFVLFVLVILIREGSLTIGQTAVIMSRDMALLLFGTYLIASRQFEGYQFKAILSGKASTFLQFITLLLLTMRYSVPSYIYPIFIALGLLALLELGSRLK